MHYNVDVGLDLDYFQTPERCSKMKTSASFEGQGRTLENTYFVMWYVNLTL